MVALAGDGALLMTGLELLTAATYRAAPLVCVLRDGKLGQIAQFQKMMTNRISASLLPDYDLEGFARDAPRHVLDVRVQAPVFVHDQDGRRGALETGGGHQVTATFTVAFR